MQRFGRLVVPTGLLVSFLLSSGVRADSSRIAFASTRFQQFGDYEVFYASENVPLPPALPDELQLTDHDLPDDRPSICSNAVKIVYESYPSFDPYSYDLMLVNNGGSGTTNITVTQAISESDPDCGPRVGTEFWIVYTEQIDHDGDPATENNHISRIKTDGTGRVQLTANPSCDDREPVWCGNNRVAFASNRDVNGDGNCEAKYDIYTMDFNGGNLLNRTNDVGADDRYPACTQDGSTLAFARKDLQTVGYDLYSKLVDDPELTLVYGGPFDDIEPSWSPGGTQIAFTETGTSYDKIRKINVNGTGLATFRPADGDPVTAHYNSPDWGAGLLP